MFRKTQSEINAIFVVHRTLCSYYVIFTKDFLEDANKRIKVVHGVSACCMSLSACFINPALYPQLQKLFVVISNFDTAGVALELNVLMINLKAELITKRV